MKSSLIVFLLFSSLCLSYSEDSIFNWINSERLSRNLPVLSVDEKLKKTARLYSEELSRRGKLSHRDRKGHNGLTRYRENGGTALRVGEIIGAGRSIIKIEKAWLKSNTHRDVILDPNWTHYGIGVTKKEKVLVIVVMFTTIYTVNLSACLFKDEAGNGNNSIIKISGRFFPRYRREIKEPILISGVKIINPDYWNSLSGTFRFFMNIKYKTSFLRLGYISTDGKMTFSDIINPDCNLLPCRDIQKTATSCRGTERR